MHRPSAAEFLVAVLDTLEDLPPELAARLVEALKQQTPERAQAIRRLLEECARD